MDLPDAVEQKVRALGPPGVRWLEGLEQTMADLEIEWDFRAGEALIGGSGGYVTTAVRSDGGAAVLKLAIPEGLEGQGSFERELMVLALGDGRGYVRVLRSDLRRRAVLLERLGRPLSALGLPVRSQIEIIASTLTQAWRPAPEGAILRTGAEQAEWLGQVIGRWWDSLDQPCRASTVRRAIGYTASRRDAFEAERSVVIHGDAHPANVLEDPDHSDQARRFKLIDPDGMVSEPAHDVAIPLRDWSDELLASDTVDVALSWCARLAQLTGVDEGAVWQWAFIERVSTGLFMISLGDPRGRDLLRVAEAWTDVSP
jgi:streptomycin 6-kinase